MNPRVDPWVIRLEKGTDFWEPNVSVVDENGDPVSFLSTELTIFPDDQTPVVWNISNGKLTHPSPGQFLFNVPASEINAYEWDTAKYKWSVTYSNTKVDGNWMEGIVRVDAN